MFLLDHYFVNATNSLILPIIYDQPPTRGTVTFHNVTNAFNEA